MKIIVIIVLLFFFYLRRPIKCLVNLFKISKLLDLYKSFFNSNGKDKEKYFTLIASKKPMSDELVNSFYYFAPSYKDFHNQELIYSFYIKLIESHDINRFNFLKYFHPKFVVQDIFFLPSKVFGFLLRHQFKVGPSFFLSCLGWIFTILISAYASEIKVVIDSLVTQITKTI